MKVRVIMVSAKIWFCTLVSTATATQLGLGNFKTRDNPNPTAVPANVGNAETNPTRGAYPKRPLPAKLFVTNVPINIKITEAHTTQQ